VCKPNESDHCSLQTTDAWPGRGNRFGSNLPYNLKRGVGGWWLVVGGWWLLLLVMVMVVVLTAWFNIGLLG